MRQPFALIAAAAALVAGAAPALAQSADVPSITITPEGPGGTGYYGAYGPSLPGVYMLNGPGASLPTGANANRGQVALPSRDPIENLNTYNNPLPTLDAWSGTLGPGIPF